MKKIRLSYLSILAGLFVNRVFANGLNRFEPLQDPYGEPSVNTAIDASSLNDPLRQGASAIANGVGGIKSTNAGTFEEAKNSLLGSIQTVLNRALGLLALTALIYLIIQGIQLLLNPKDDEVKKIRTRVETATRAIGGIGLSWLFISFVFYVIGLITQ